MDSTLSHQLTQDELNAAALYQFVYTDVTHQMICYLAEQTRQVISCDPPSEQSAGQAPDAADDGPIPELEEFIAALVQCSNVQVPTLMSTLVYLTRLRARLQPQAKGRRSTPHRIFLAALILSAKYLNDSSPKNKHWARYTKVQVKVPSFEGVREFKFHTAEVNEMERQLLFLLNFELRITEHDLYRELNPYLAPIRNDIAAQHARRQRRKLQERERQRKQQQEQAAWSQQAAAYSYPSPPSSRGHSRAGSESRSSSGTRESYTPSLTSSSTSSRTSPASSTWSANSGKSPLGDADQAYVYCADVEEAHLYQHRGGDMLPYEVTAEEIRAIQEAQKAAGNNKGGVRAIFGRVFGNTAPVAAR